MPYTIYHTGIVGENNNQVWRRISNGVEVQLDGWHRDYPNLNIAGYNNLYWSYFDNAYNNNTIWNSNNRFKHFICEYKE